MKSITALLLLALSSLCAAASGQSVPGQSSSKNSPNIVVHEGEEVVLPETPAVLCSRSPQVCDSLPDAPSYSYARTRPGFWTFMSEDDPSLRTNHEMFHDKTLILAESAWLGAITYDVELTHQGLAHHRCVEQNGDSQHPSRGALYLGSLPEFAVGTAWNWLAAKYVWKPLILEFPVYSGLEHIRGGSGWLLNCW